ncbi:MAG: hypothetical protein QMD08_08210 [Actinomycetota bacterium]|nr:hypothetical protein [Actinomycetota bacterium]
MIVKRGKEWCVISHRTGKNLGCYPTEKEAKERLGQIWAWKRRNALLGKALRG